MNKKNLQDKFAGTSYMRKREYLEKTYPFWQKHEKLSDNFYKQEQKLEKKMNNALRKQGLDMKVEFFNSEYGSGIGAGNYEDRKNLPLIHDSEFGEYKQSLELKKKNEDKALNESD